MRQGPWLVAVVASSLCLAACSTTVQNSTPQVAGSPVQAPAAGPVVQQPDTSAQQASWRAITDSPSDPLYVLIKDFRPQPDGSVLLIVDPLSPDTQGNEGPGCEAWTFTDPAGSWCLSNQRTRNRKVTLRPDADIGIGDGTIAISDLGAYLPDYLSRTGSYLNDPISYITLDADGFATSLVTIGAMTSGGGMSVQTGEGDGYQVDVVLVPNFVDMLESDADRVAASAGIFLVTQVISMDPSIAAQANGSCLVVDQDYPPGTQVNRNERVTVFLDCPRTGS